MKLYSINGTYGSGNTPAEIFVAENRDGSKWYCVDGSANVNLTDDEIIDGTNVEDLADTDTFTAGYPIYSLEGLEAAINS